MNNIEYVNGALRTEAPVTPEMVGRFLHPGLVVLLQEAILKIIEEGQNLDHLKKHLFYNKALPHLPANDRLSPGMVARLSDPGVIRLLHAAIGFATEAGELFEALYAHVYNGEPLDTVNLIEEAGDQFWYMAIFADALSVTFENIEDINHRKLRARYPERFDRGQALTRDIPQERRVLEATPEHPAVFQQPGGKLTARPAQSHCETATGLQAHIDSWDNEHGYIHGYVEGNPEPQTWGIPDGICLTSNDPRYNLNMETMK